MTIRNRFVKRLLLITIFIMFILMTSLGLFFSNYVNSYNLDKKQLNNNTDNVNIIDSLIDEIERSTSPININNNTNILFLSGDSIKEIDFCTVININRQRKEITAMILPSNTGINKENSIMKLGALFGKFNGRKIEKNEATNEEYIQGSIKENLLYIENTIDIKIDYYCYFNEKIIKEVINALGGIEYYIPADLNYKDPIKGISIHLKKGLQLLDGDASLDLLKFIKPNKKTEDICIYYDGSQEKRINTQEAFLKELFRQKNSLVYIKRLVQISDVLLSEVTTNLNPEIMLKLLPSENFFNGYDFNTCSFPGNEKKINKSVMFIKNSYEMSRNSERYFK